MLRIQDVVSTSRRPEINSVEYFVGSFTFGDGKEK
jgi:hypothetical protein